MPHTSIDGEPVFTAFSDGGEAGDLILVHGSGGDHSHWPEQLLQLPGVRVHGIDLPGHGISGGQARDSVNAYADVVAGLVKALKSPPKTVVAGHSLGGAIALTLALRQPDWLSGIILVGTGARLRVAPAILDGLLGDDPGAAVDTLTDMAFGPGAPDEAVERIRSGWHRIDPRVTHADLSACDRFDVMDRLAEIRIPALVIAGTKDRLTPLKYGQYLHEHIPDSRLAVIEGAGHNMALERPAEIVSEVAGFFRALR